LPLLTHKRDVLGTERPREAKLNLALDNLSELVEPLDGFSFADGLINDTKIQWFG